MFEIGELIVYGSTGVCVVKDITTMDMPDIPKERLYYVLEPYQQTGSKIFTPVENPKITLRHILTKEEVLALIDEIPEIESLYITNEKAREQQYKESLYSCQCRQWIQIIKTLYLRKQQRVIQGKKITATDERYLRQAENYLYTEFAIALGKNKEEMEDYITKRIHEQRNV